MFAAKQRLFSPDPNEVVVELVGPLRAGHALDLGAGEGRHAVWLAQQGWHVTAVDFSAVALDRIRRRATTAGVEIDCVLADADAGDLRAPANGYDLVLIAYMHPRPGVREATFAAVAEAVAPGGRLLVVGLDRADSNAGPRDDWRYSPGLLADAFPGVALERCESVTRDETRHGAGVAVDTLAWGRRIAR